jgi:hypothetical protein
MGGGVCTMAGPRAAPAPDPGPEGLTIADLLADAQGAVCDLARALVGVSAIDGEQGVAWARVVSCAARRIEPEDRDVATMLRVGFVDEERMQSPRLRPPDDRGEKPEGDAVCEVLVTPGILALEGYVRATLAALCEAVLSDERAREAWADVAPVVAAWDLGARTMTTGLVALLGAARTLAELDDEDDERAAAQEVV